MDASNVDQLRTAHLESGQSAILNGTAGDPAKDFTSLKFFANTMGSQMPSLLVVLHKTPYNQNAIHEQLKQVVQKLPSELTDMQHLASLLVEDYRNDRSAPFFQKHPHLVDALKGTYPALIDRMSAFENNIQKGVTTLYTLSKQPFPYNPNVINQLQKLAVAMMGSPSSSPDATISGMQTYLGGL